MTSVRSTRARLTTVRRRRTRTLVALLVLVSTSLLTGCAGNDGEPGDRAVSPKPTSPVPVPESTPPPTTSPGEVTAELTISLDETGSGEMREMTLTCGPAGGDHPDPEAACAALAAVGAAAFAPPPKDQMCTEQWGGPQVAFVLGTVDGTPVRAQFSRTNGCEISRWDALAPLLGNAGGAT